MKKTLLFTKQNSNNFYMLLAFCLCLNYGWSQQVIGQFPVMDGGFESQTATTTLSSAGSSQSGTAQTEWTVSSTGNSDVREIADNAGMARTGTFSAAWSVKVGSTNVRLQSPSPTLPTIQTNTEYTVQFFYKTNSDPGADLDPGIYLNNTASGNATDKTDATTFAANTYTKTYGTVTTGAAFNASNWAVARITTTVAGGFNETVRVDDFVVYAGVYDDTAPSAATAGTYANNAGTAAIGWTAPAGGVDGGGYVVVKYTSMPAANDDPNQNGIYKIGNTVAGNISGAVAYIGTATTFNDTYVAGTYYKIYAVDKAFNYSTELIVSDASLGVTKNQIEGLKIYPNPAKDYLNIDSNSVQISSVAMYNILGAQVLSEKALVNNRLNISGLAKGIYMLKINAEGASTTRKIVKE